jgi:glycosyltransferase involved in cell wall biosynthesis
VAARLRDTALDILLTPPRRPHRLAVVTSWGVRCGVAEYTRHLLASFTPAEAIAEVVVLADAREREAEAAPALTAWRMGDGESMDGLAGAILRADADIVMIQHQPGLFGFNALAALLRSPVLRSRVVTVTLHTVERLEELAPRERGEAVEALAAVDRVIVHTLADLDRLRRLGLVANATLVPQGTQVPGPMPELRDIGPGDAPMIGCYGFFLPGKGIPELIEAAGRLRARWPGLKLRLVNAAYDSDASRAEIVRAREMAEAVGMTQAIEWHTDFLREEASRALLSECDAVAVATQESREGSSASLRSALAAGAPVIVTPLMFFEEAGDAVARFPGIEPAALAEGLAAFLADGAARRRVQSDARAWLAERCWSVIGPRTLGMLLGLAASRDGPKC